MMETQVLFNIIVGVAGLFGGWILNNISRSIEKLDDDVREMPLTYVTQDSYNRDQNRYQREFDEIKGMLRLIFDRLEDKADK
jgi:phage regulator Rha-like protein